MLVGKRKPNNFIYYFCYILISVYILKSAFCISIVSNLLNINFKSKKIMEIANYDYPKNSPQDNEYVLVVMGTNDVHGGAYERNLEYENQKFEKGGFKYLSGVLDIIRNEYNGNFLWLDAGDQFSGTYENIVTEGKIIKDFYNIMGVDAVTLGNHEWDRGEEWLRNNMKTEIGKYYKDPNRDRNEDKNDNNTNKYKMKRNLWDEKMQTENKFLYLVSNLYPKEGTEDLPNKIASKIFVMENSLRIGVIGLTTYETLYNNTHPPKNFVLMDYYETTIRESKLLREKGVDAIVLLTHIGTHCAGESKEELMELKLRDESYMKAKTYCDDELGDLASKLKNNEVDLIIGGEGVEAHHFVNGIPILQNPMTTISANFAYLKFKKNPQTNKFELEKRLIEGPVPLCMKIFSFNKRCDFVPTEPRKELVEYTWHGQRIIPNKNIHKIFENEADKIIRKAKENYIFRTDVRLERGNNKDNLLGNLLCDMVRNITSSDACVINYGSLRTFWEPGRVSEYDINNMFPFGGNIVKYSISGKYLKFMIKTLQEGKKSFYSTGGLKMTIKENCEKQKELVHLTFDNNQEINEDKNYSVSGFDFLILKGAVDMAKVINNPDKSSFKLPEAHQDFGDLRIKLIEKFKEIRNVQKKDIKTTTIDFIQDSKCFQ